MTDQPPAKAGKILGAVWRFCYIGSLNLLRRGLIWGRYTLLCWQQKKLRRALRQLGGRVFAALERGEMNPLVDPDVSALLSRAKDIKEAKDRQHQAIAAIKERMRQAWRPPAPPRPPDSEKPLADQPGPPDA
jgi:hypothetical protein